MRVEDSITHKNNALSSRARARDLTQAIDHTSYFA
jgi:hypothetical protein